MRYPPQTPANTLSINNIVSRSISGMLAFVALNAWAIPPVVPVTEWIPPFETWENPCSSALLSPDFNTRIAKLLEAEAMLVPIDKIEPRADNPNYWRMKTATAFNVLPDNGIPFCAGSEPFGPGQTRLATSGRSGFLVDHDIVVTASHVFTSGMSFNPAAFVVVFGANTGAPGQPCSTLDPEFIPAENVSLPKFIAPLIVDMLDETSYSDVAAFRLQTPVTSRAYLRLRRAGSAVVGDPIAIADHPWNLSTKLQTGVQFNGRITDNIDPNVHMDLFLTVFSASGSSGSALLNLKKNFVENVVGAPAITCNEFHVDTVLNCMSSVNQCAGPASQSQNWVNRGLVSELASHVPTPELRVVPLDDTTVRAVAGQLTTFPPTTYSLTASSSSTVNTLTSFTLRAYPSGEPALLNFSPLSTAIPAGTTQTVTVTGSVPATLACGIYARTVEAHDWSHSFVDAMTTTFEVGMTDYDVASPAAPSFESAKGYSNPAQMQYTLTNNRSTPIDLSISSDVAWLDVGGTPRLIHLSAQGQPGDTATMSIALSSNAYTMAAASYSGGFTITNLSPCSFRKSEREFPVQLLRGRISTEVPIVDVMPLANTPFVIDMTVPYELCPTNVVSQLVVAPISEAIGGPFGIHLQTWMPSVMMTIQKGPGLSTMISRNTWSHEPLPTGWNVPAYTDPTTGYPVEELVLDDQVSLPPNGNGMSVFLNRNTQGIWRLNLQDSRLASATPQALMRWKMVFWDPTSGPSTRCGP